MAAPVIIIEVAAPQANPSGTAALVRACDEAVRGGRCVLSKPGQDPAQPEAVAIVSWEGSRQERVRVEVGVRRAPNPEWLVRELLFQAEDSAIERWRATGLVIATLVGKLTEEEMPVSGGIGPKSATGSNGPGLPAGPPVGSSAPREGPPGVSGHVPREAAEHSQRAAWLDGGVLSGPGTSHGSWRSGAWVGGAWLLGRSPMFVGFAADYSWVPTAATGISAQWLTFAAGLGGHVDLPLGIEVDGRIEGITERLSAAARHPISGVEDARRGWATGIRLGVNGSWPGDTSIAPLIGFQWSLVETGTVVRVAGTDRDRIPPWAIRGLVGLRVRLP